MNEPQAAGRQPGTPRPKPMTRVATSRSGTEAQPSNNTNIKSNNSTEGWHGEAPSP